MKNTSLLIIGCGSIGQSIAAQASDVDALTVFGASRSPRVNAGIQMHSADYTDASSMRLLLEECRAESLLMTLTPADYSEQGYRSRYLEGTRNVLSAIRYRPRRIFFVSSTSVYGQNDGSTVDETSPTNPDGFSGQTMLQCEQTLSDSGLPFTSIRFGGIYGPDSTRLIDKVRARDFSAGEHFTNRIHRYDCAALIL